MKKKDYQVVVFVADWCPHCKNMKNNQWVQENVLEEVKSYHGGKPVFVSCNKPQNQHLSQEFNIESYPTVVIMDEDHNVKKRGNNMSADKLIEFLKEF